MYVVSYVKELAIRVEGSVVTQRKQTRSEKFG